MRKDIFASFMRRKPIFIVLQYISFLMSRRDNCRQFSDLKYKKKIFGTKIISLIPSQLERRRKYNYITLASFQRQKKGRILSDRGDYAVTMSTWQLSTSLDGLHSWQNQRRREKPNVSHLWTNTLHKKNLSAAVCYVYFSVCNLCQVIDSQLQINKVPMKKYYMMIMCNANVKCCMIVEITF